MISLHCAPAVGSERAAPQPGQLSNFFPIIFVKDNRNHSSRRTSTYLTEAIILAESVLVHDGEHQTLFACESSEQTLLIPNWVQILFDYFRAIAT
jgi:hypothetical protein